MDSTQSMDDPSVDDPSLEGDVLIASGDVADHLPSSGLLSFYDRLRDRILDFVDRRGGKIGDSAAQALLLVPDIFILMVRMALDREVPSSTRTLLASALAYFILPVDLLPEVLVGPTGFLDDLVLGVMVLAQAFSNDLEPIAAKHWSGKGSVRTAIRDVLSTAHSLVGHDLYDRITRYLKRRGIEVDRPSDATA